MTNATMAQALRPTALMRAFDAANQCDQRNGAQVSHFDLS